MTEINLSKIKALFLDLDGVLWSGSAPIGDLHDIFSKFQRAGVRPILGTNNSSQTPRSYQQKLAGFGVEFPTEQVISPAIAAAHLFKKEFSKDVVIHVFGSQGLKDYLTAAGFQFSDEKADIVLASLDKEMTYQKVATAMRLIKAGAKFYATNLDNVLASEKGWLPGGGVMVNAVETCTGEKPVVIGKPQPLMIEIAMQKFGLKPEEIIAVGDRYDTDIQGGINAGCGTVMVLTGFDSRESIAHYEKQPSLICRDLNELADLLIASKLNNVL